MECVASNSLLNPSRLDLSIFHFIEALGIDDGTAKGKYTPLEIKSIVTDSDAAEACESFSYSTVIGMLLYLPGHTCPDIAISYAVSCCAWYMFCVKHLRELPLKSIGYYLKQTSNCRMVI